MINCLSCAGLQTLYLLALREGAETPDYRYVSEVIVFQSDLSCNSKAQKECLQFIAEQSFCM